eukprot:CAMPEP_0169399118 /NCGR_PEP_ID=MMETSP1017-20121227/53023_1 /TAXON_ID=342587 /ORGANISM="Karlodinium micrum, Strain CCMP2283" /LENGTH=43 /DNA_ID= /DNA_START= /DNA_END= /DNA_ORIENTATION=
MPSVVSKGLRHAGEMAAILPIHSAASCATALSWLTAFTSKAMP